MTTLVLHRPAHPIRVVAPIAVPAWLIAWFVNLPAANWVAFDLLGLERGSHVGEAVAFFLYDVPKVLLLLLGIVTVVTFLRSYFPPERVARHSQAGARWPEPSLPRASGSLHPSVPARRCRCSSASSRPASRWA